MVSDRGRYSGFNWHVEFHNTNPKKDKAADCIYLTEDRICQNKDSYYFLGKCFVASNCLLKLKSNDVAAPARNKTYEEKKLRIKKIKCSLPKNCFVKSKQFGEGRLVEYDESSMIMSVKFGNRIVKFQYPNAILDKHIILADYDYSLVQHDISQAEKV